MNGNIGRVVMVCSVLFLDQLLCTRKTYATVLTKVSCFSRFRDILSKGKVENWPINSGIQEAVGGLFVCGVSSTR